MKVAGARIFRYSLPLRRPMTVPGASPERRDGLLFQLTDADGSIGWGDAAPLPGLSPETFAETLDGLKTASAALIDGKNIPWDAMPPSASFAAETALDTISRDSEPADNVTLCALLAGSADEIVEKARRAVDSGFRATKMKVGRSEWGEDVRLAAAVRERLGPDIELRLDANRAWSFEMAAEFSRNIADIGIAFIEEPLRDWHGLARLWEATRVPFALDETLQEHRPALAAAARGDWPADAAELGAAIALSAACVIKPTLLHFKGMREWLRGGALDGRPVVVSAAFESGVGIAALARYASILRAPRPAAGLDTYDWLADDVLQARLPLDAGVARLDALRTAAQHVDTSRIELLLECGEVE